MMNKKGLSVIVTVLLMVTIAAISGTALMLWFQSFQTEFTIKQQSQADVKDMEILGLQYLSGDRAVLGIRNDGGAYHIVEQVNINDVQCDVIGTNVVDGISNIVVNCPTTINDSYEIEVISSRGVAAKTLTSIEVSDEEIENVVANLTITFRASSSCQLWETKLFGMSFSNRSHVQLASENTYGYSVCANSSAYTLTTNCAGVYDTLFYIGDTTNSHLYVDNSSAFNRSNYYSWNEVCLAGIFASGVDVIQATSSPGSQYQCFASVIGSDYAGRSVGYCDMFTDKLWVRVY